MPKIKQKMKEILLRYKNLIAVLIFVLCATAIFAVVLNLRNFQIRSLSSSLIYNAVDADSLEARAGDGAEYSLDNNTGKLIFITNEQRNLPVDFPSGAPNDAEAVSKGFINDYGEYFGLKNPASELSRTKKSEDGLKMTHIWYSQRYSGVPVFGSQIAVHVTDGLLAASANGRVVPGISIDVKPSVTKEKATEKAKKIWKQKFKSDESDVLKSDLFILNKGIIENKQDGKDYLAWQVELYNKEIKQHEFYFIDAKKGDLVYQITGTKKINRRMYDCSLGSCELDLNFGGYIYGRSEGQLVRGANPIVGGSDVDNLYDMLGSMHTYLWQSFHRNGGNNQGGIGDGISSAVGNTDGYTYIDYVWPDCPNAFFDGFSINFCQGLAVNDVVGHEYGHSVVDFSVSGGLTYSYESGALHEAYADVSGEALERYRTGNSDWLAGASINVPGLVGPLRNMINPPALSSSLGKYPDRSYSSGFYCGSSDAGGVHHNSTVVSHAMYLASKGGSFNGCTITGIGQQNTEEIFYRAVSAYFVSSTGFNGAYNAINAACTDLHGSQSSAICTQMRNAMQSVEMNQGGKCSSSARKVPSCAGTAGPISQAPQKNINPKIIATSGPGETTKMQPYDRYGNKQGREIANLFPSSYKGGAGVVSIDANNNGVKDQIGIFARDDGGPQARVFGIRSNSRLVFQGQMFLFDKTNRDGLSVTVGDFDDDGYDDDVAACLTGASDPVVRVYRDARGVDNWRKIGEFRAPLGKVGCNLGTFQYDNKADEILVSPHQGPNYPWVLIYTVGGTLKSWFGAYDAGVNQGVTPSGIGGRIYTTPNNGTSHVNVFDKYGSRKNFWWVYDKSIRGDFINVAGDIDADGVDEILTAPFGGNGPHVKSYETSGKERTFPNFFAFSENKRNGAGIAVIENWHGEN